MTNLRSVGGNLRPVRLSILRGRELGAEGIANVAVPSLAAVVLAAATAFALWFFEYEPDLDALGLFNPVYTALHTGHTTYPIYAYPTEMVEHPPTHYWILAQIMRVTGLSPQAAAFVPIVFWVAATAFVVAGARWRVRTKAALLLATWMAVVVWAPPNYIRPDVAVAATWITGLVALESGRIAGWKAWRLALGSFAIALASMLHYPASLAVAGVLVYALWAGWTLRSRARIQALVALLLPAAVLLSLYAAIFVFPHLHDIRYVTSHQNAQGHGFFAALLQTRDEYRFVLRAHIAGNVVDVLMWPLLRWGIPAALVAPPVLAIRRSTRGLALASLPYLFTLLFYAREKTYYYYAPDAFIYFAAFGVVVFWGLERAVRHLRIGRPNLRRVAAPVAVGVGAIVIGAFAQPALHRVGTFTWHPRHEDMEVARAAGAQMVSANGTLLTNDLALWYITGANRVYSPRDLDESLDVSGLDFTAYARQFTAIAEESYDSWSTGNRQQVDITTLLRDGTLSIDGFYFGAGWTKGQPTAVRYLLLSPPRRPLRGYAWDGHDVVRFAAAPGGRYALIGALCPLTSSWIPGTKWQTSLFLPGAVDNTLTIQRQVRIGITPPGTRRAAWASLQHDGCRRSFERPLAIVERQPVGTFLADWRRTPRSHVVMTFPQADPSATNELYRPREPVRVAASVDLAKASGWGSTPTVHTGGQIVVSSPPQQFNSMMQVDLPAPNASSAWIRVRLHVLEGLVAICSEDTSTSGCLGRINVSPGGTHTLYLRVPTPAPHLALYVQNRASADAKVAISSIELLVARGSG